MTSWWRWSHRLQAWTPTLGPRAAALRAAVADARRRAEAIAAECGTGRVTVLDVADAGLLPGGGAPEPRVEAMARAFAADAGQGVAVAPEDVEVLVRLHARFEA